MNSTIDSPQRIEIFSKLRSMDAELLNKVHEELYQSYASEEHRKFLLLKVQTAIVQFELCSGFLNLLMTPENCFARKVILKGLIHIVFEYRTTLKNHYIKTLIDLCDSKNFNSEKENLSKITKKYRKAIKQIDKFQDLRNMATGHYDHDTSEQVSLIESINESKSIEVIKQFLFFNIEVLESLYKVGRKK